MAFAWHRNRNQNTTEQKTWTAGQALDNLLAPAWRSPDALLELLTVTSAKAFTKALSAQKGFGGSLVFSHTLEYLQLWDSASMHPLFSCHLRKCIMSRYIRPGKNCQNYLDICNARSERGGTPGNYSLKNLSADVLDLLPKSVELVDGGVVEFPHFFAADGQQSTCKAIQVVQTPVALALYGDTLSLVCGSVRPPARSIKSVT